MAKLGVITISLIDMMPDEVKKKLHRKTYNENETILFAENENNYVYFLIEGKAEAYVPNLQGSFATIHLYEPGSFFGELEQFYVGRKPVEISAMTPCVAYALHREDFFDWMKKDFEVTKFIIREIAYKLIINSEYIEEVSLLTVKERLLRCVATHYRRGDIDKLTKEQITKETKAPMRSINRAIAECDRQGILSYKNQELLILDITKLQNIPG
ncbi:Crp/Fnr family transcriptional regulator [Anoxybacterium hadale]|jgi:CRP-like cAMP-binding protein|uniref:Crp/Fnr family transcriptional regulator n=1 Tax=Anoxybacterium hadale TaxID=3408580 RepID=UPI003B004E65